MRPQAVIFDHDGVLCAVDYAAATRFFGRLLPISLRELGRRWNTWLQEAMKQTPQDCSWTAFCEHLDKDLKLPDSSKQELWAFDYLSLFHAFADARPALLEARRRNLRVGVLSNSPLVNMVDLVRRIGLGDLVEVIADSQMTGIFKPAPEAYLRMAEALKVEAAACLFIDDDPGHVDGAMAVGMRGYKLDRQRAEHALEERVIRDLTALPLLMGAGVGGAAPVAS